MRGHPGDSSQRAREGTDLSLESPCRVQDKMVVTSFLPPKPLWEKEMESLPGHPYSTLDPKESLGLSQL